MAPVENGYWGKPTATIDWCENNYEVNFYIAEMYNTVSNLMMIIPPIWGMIEVINQKFEKRFIFCHFLLLVVGLGSWAFHMTLLYEMQLFDELPMVWGTCMLVYRVSEVRTVPDKNKIFSNVWLVLLLTSFASLFTAVYLLWPQPIFQHASYGILVITSFALEIRLLKIQPCKVCKRLFVLSVSTYLFGFFLWNIDNIFCPNLKLLRSSVSPVIGSFTQLHGWWHFLAGYGTYLQVFFCIHSYNDFCQKRLKKKDQKELEFCQLGFGLRWSKKQRSE